LLALALLISDFEQPLDDNTILRLVELDYLVSLLNVPECRSALEKMAGAHAMEHIFFGLMAPIGIYE
jgi:hypothetical protein